MPFRALTDKLAIELYRRYFVFSGCGRLDRRKGHCEQHPGKGPATSPDVRQKMRQARGLITNCQAAPPGWFL